jgi:hypothetical protein
MNSSVLMYIKDGELEMTDKEIVLNSNVYNAMDLDKVEMKVIGYRGQAGSRGGKDGTGNKIKIFTKSNDILEKAFVINTSVDLDNLKEILKNWKTAGLKVKIDGFDLK